MSLTHLARQGLTNSRGAFAHRHDTLRLEWLDTAKGIGIILVVIGHSIGGLIDTSLYVPEFVIYAFFIIYLFHMPLFFTLSVILVKQRLESKLSQFGKSLLYKMAYPYFLWSIAQVVLVWLMSGYVNAPLTNLTKTLVWLPIVPTGQFWFIQALFVFHLVSLLCLYRANAVLLLVVGIALRILDAFLAFPVPLHAISMFYIYYMIGVVLGPSINVVAPMNKQAVWLTASTLAISVLLIVTAVITLQHCQEYIGFFHLQSAGIAEIAWSNSYIIAAVVTTMSIIYSSNFRYGIIRDMLMYIGRLSFPIFVLHIVFVSGLRIILVRQFGISDYMVILPTICVIGLVGPILIFEVLKKIGLSRQLGLA
jgi:fucose 4-O-acetylase-like acetyltransferase